MFRRALPSLLLLQPTAWRMNGATPSTSSTQPTPAGEKGTKTVVRRRIVKKVLRPKGSAPGAATTPMTEKVELEARQPIRPPPPATGDELRRELRGIPNNAPATGGAAAKTPMVKGFRISEVSSLCGPSDCIFARRLPSGGCQFFAWPGTSVETASRAIISMPDTIRTVHALFGREKVPMDIVMDIDCPVPQEHWSMSKIRPFQLKLLDEVLTVLKEEIEKIGETVQTQVVLQSPNLKKASFHVHTKLKDVAFEDYNSLHGFLDRFKDRIPAVDMQIYRQNGMLRMFGCMKENHTSAIVVFDDPKWQIGFPKGKVSDKAAALHSVCIREAGTYKRLLTFDPPRVHSPSYSAAEGGENKDGSRRFAPVLLPRTEREAIENASRWLRQASETEVGEWRCWISLGLAAFRIAHHFQNSPALDRPAMETMLDAWTEASRKCPLKYKSGECQARWATFDVDKIPGRSNWWSAYSRLGSLEVPQQENLERELRQEEENRRRRTARRQD